MSCRHLTAGEYANDRAAYFGCPDCAQEHEEREAEDVNTLAYNIHFDPSPGVWSYRWTCTHCFETGTARSGRAAEVAAQNHADTHEPAAVRREW